jgi:hypothetical protein
MTIATVESAFTATTTKATSIFAFIVGKHDRCRERGGGPAYHGSGAGQCSVGSLQGEQTREQETDSKCGSHRSEHENRGRQSQGHDLASVIRKPSKATAQRKRVLRQNTRPG